MKKKTNKIIRYLKVYKKKLRTLNRRKVATWFIRNIKGHPLILGIVAFSWASYLIGLLFEKKTFIYLAKSLLKFHAILFLTWFILVLFSNALRDRERVKWYFKKRFVFIMLILFPPIGVILLWSGSHFKKVTKIILTVVFAIIFIASRVYQQKRVFNLLKMTTFERIVEMFGKQKGKIYLKPAASDALKGFILTQIPEKKRIKLAVSDIYKLNASSITSIITKDASDKEIGEGSGFLVSPDGIIVTNMHVIRGAQKVEVKLGENIFKEVLLLKIIPAFDIALLKVNAQGFSPVNIGDSDQLTSGQFVVALGNPLGLEQSVSTGIISAIRSSAQIKLLQITAPLSPGSSGGPLLNEYGEVVGITTLASFFLAQNVNFAIPINYLKQALTQE